MSVVLPFVDEWARVQPDRPAVSSHNRTLSYAELRAHILARRRRLMRLDLPRGRVAGLLINDLVESWIAALALHSLGFVTVAIETRAQPDNLPNLGVGLIVTLAGEAHDPAPDPLRALPELKLAALAPAEVEEAKRAPRERLEEGGGHILLTSGTTGAYKALLVDVKAQRVRIRNLIEIYGTTPDAVAYLSGFKLFAAAGFNRPLRTWAAGGHVVFNQVETVSRWFKRPALTDAVLTPAGLSDLLAHADQLAFNPNLHLYIVAGALPWHQAEAVMRRLTPNVYTELGSAEAGTVAVTRVRAPGDQQAHVIHPTRRVEVVGDDDQPAPPGVVGAVRIRRREGDVDHYLGDPAATATFFRGDYFYPGDLGRFRADGRLELRGRATEVVNLRGTKLPIAPLEQAVQDRLQVTGVCIVPGVGAGGEEQLHVLVETDRPLDADDVRAALKGLPPVMNLFHALPAFPRNRMGKIDRKALRALKPQIERPLDEQLGAADRPIAEVSSRP